MNVMNFFIVLAILGTLIILFAGGASMAHGGRFDKLHAEEFMWGRVTMQGITIGLMVISMLFWS